MRETAKKLLFFKSTLCVLCLNLASLSLSAAEGSDESLALVETFSQGPTKDPEGYTVNFNNVPIIEYLRFVSKITNLNFVFDETELQFSMTLISEEPISTKNIMAALIQVLRIHNLSLLEQDNNILITQSKLVNQIPTISAADLPEQKYAPLVTRIFRIKNVSANSIAAIIRPMISTAALIEVLNETRQLIVTDITTNVDKIATLLESLDTPHSPLEIDSYVAKQVPLNELVNLATQIVAPFAEGNPLTFVQQAETNTIFVVSTPSLIERVMSTLEDLDVVAKATESSLLGKETFLIYKIKQANQQQLEISLETFADSLEKSKSPDVGLIRAIRSMKWIKETNSLFFTGNEQSLKRLEELLPTFDVVSETTQAALSSTTNFWIYNPQTHSGEELEKHMREIAKNLKNSGLADPSFLHTVDNMKWVPASNSLVFTGDPKTLARIEEIVRAFDSKAVGVSKTFTYRLKYISYDRLQKALNDISKNLDPSNIQDELLSKAIQNMKWSKENNTVFTLGDSATVQRLQELISDIDTSEQAKDKTQVFFLYKLEHTQGTAAIAHLKSVASNLSSSSLENDALLKTIKDIKWIKETNSLLIVGSPNAVEQVKTLIEQYDSSISGPKIASNYFIYKPTRLSPQDLEDALKNLGKDLQEAGLSDPDLLQSISTVRYVDSTKSLLFTGTTESLDKVKELLMRLDLSPGEIAGIKQISNITFYLYKLQFVSATQFMNAMKVFAVNLSKSDHADKELVNTINGMKWIKETNSILFTGPDTSLQKIEILAQKFDNSGLAGPQKAGPQTYILYTPRNQTGEELISILCDFEQQLIQTGVEDKELFDTINNLKWIEKTSSLLISGTAESITKVQHLLDKFDVPGKGDTPSNIETIENTSFLVYKLQYHQGSDIQEALRQIAQDILATTAATNEPLVNAINTSQWIKITNSLLVSGQQETLTKLRELIQNLDVPLRQAFIEVLIIETSLINAQSFGLQWGGKMQYFNKAVGGTSNMPVTNPVTQVAPNVDLGNAINSLNPIATPPVFPSNLNPTFPNLSEQGFNFGVIGDIIMHKGKSFFSLGSLIKALQTDNDSTIVLNPKIITQDNNNSTIFVGQNIPFTGASVQTTGGINQQTTTNIEYRDIGVNLSITPVIGNGDVITLDISNDITAQIQSTTNNQNTSLTGIQTTHTSLNTRVMIPNDHFLVLSGMIRDNKSRFKTGLPCLGGLPVVGALFSTNDRLNTKDNLIIFIRPHIIESFDDYKKLTQDQETLYKNQAVLPVLKEEFDAGVDMVKTPENE